MKPPTTALAGAMRRASPGVYYYASFAALPVLGLLQTRVLTSLLSQSSYGALQLVTPIVSWCVILGGLGVPQYLVRFYSRDGHTLFWKGLSIALLGTGVVALVLVAVALRTDRGVTGVEPGPRFALLLVVAVFVGPARRTGQGPASRAGAAPPVQHRGRGRASVRPHRRRGCALALARGPYRELPVGEQPRHAGRSPSARGAANRGIAAADRNAGGIRDARHARLRPAHRGSDGARRDVRLPQSLCDRVRRDSAPKPSGAT